MYKIWKPVLKKSKKKKYPITKGFYKTSLTERWIFWNGNITTAVWNKNWNIKLIFKNKELLQNKEKISSKKNMPLVLKYSWRLPNISEVVRKILLQINLKFCNEFYNKQTVVFKRNIIIEQLIGGQLIKYQKVTKNKLEKWRGKNLDL